MHPNKRTRRFTATFNLCSVDIYRITTSHGDLLESGFPLILKIYQYPFRYYDSLAEYLTYCCNNICNVT